MTVFGPDAAYTDSQFRVAVNLSAVLGWGVAVGAILVPILMHRHGNWAAILWVLGTAVLIGLPIAFTACWLIAAPVLKRVMFRPLSWGRAALWGGLITTMIEFVGVAISRVRGFLHSLDDSFNYQLGGGEYVKNIDGILTPYGWWLQAQSSAFFIACGVLVALIIRGIIGPGNNMAEE